MSWQKDFFDFSKERGLLFAILFYVVWLIFIFGVAILLYYFSYLLYGDYSLGSRLTDVVSGSVCALLAFNLLKAKGKKIDYKTPDLTAPKLLIAAAAVLGILSPFYGLLIPAYLSTIKRKNRV
jgi:hypothetical protein